MKRLILFFCLLSVSLFAQPIIYTVDYGNKPANPPSLTPKWTAAYKGLQNVKVVTDNWFYASRERADAVNADAFVIPGGSTSDTPFYDGRLDNYIALLRNPGRPTIGFCAGLQFLLMAQGGICVERSGEIGQATATIFEWNEIFEGAPNPFSDRVWHNYSMTALPDCYRNYASTRNCYISFVKHISMPVYGSQLHIEAMNNSNSAGPAILSNFRNRIMARLFHGIAEAIGSPGEAGCVNIVWWAAKTTAPVTYQVFHAVDVPEFDYSQPLLTTDKLSAELSDLDPTRMHYFAVRADCDEFVDENTAVYPLRPDGHHTLTFQNGVTIDGWAYDSGEATIINSAHANANYGHLGANGYGKLYWWGSGLVQFPELETYLSGKTISKAEMTWPFSGGVTDQTTAEHAAEFKIFQVNKKWQEGRGTTHLEAEADEVTWNAAAHDAVQWEVPGCQGNSDRDPLPLAEFTIRGDGSEIAFDGTVELPAELVQTWVDFPDSNCGLLFEKTDTYPHSQYFTLKDNDDNWFMNHPRLIVEYLDAAQSQVAFQENSIVPQTCALQSNYPNPFNPTTTIPLTISVSQSVRLAIFNITGQQICELFSGKLSAGTHQYCWNGQNDAGSVMPSGVYLAVLQAGNQLSTRRMMLMK